MELTIQARLLRTARSGVADRKVAMMQLHHVRRGTGKPLLLIPGLGATWQSWNTIFDALAPEREVIAIDLPGFGATPPLPGEISIATLCDAVADFIDEQNLAGIDLVGSSMGARMVLELARRGVGGTTVALDPGGFWSPGQRRIFGISLRTSIALVRMLQPVLPVLTVSQPISRCATALVRSLRPLPALGRPRSHHPAHPRQHRLTPPGSFTPPCVASAVPARRADPADWRREKPPPAGYGSGSIAQPTRAAQHDRLKRNARYLGALVIKVHSDPEVYRQVITVRRPFQPVRR